MARNKGICAICGKGEKLSLEHVPPKCAGNDQRREIFTLVDWQRAGENWDEITGTRPQPEGVGYLTICKKCNEYSGAHYVPEFCKWTATGFDVLRQVPLEKADAEAEPQGADVGIERVRPSPFVKEVIAMLLAVNGDADADFRRMNPESVDFVLNRDVIGLPDKYRVYLSLYFGPAHRYAPLFGAVIDGREVLVTSIDHPPYSYVLSIGTPLDHLPVVDITEFTRCRHDEQRNVRFVLLCGFGHTPFPLDYRSSARVAADDAAGKKNITVPVTAVKSDGSII